MEARIGGGLEVGYRVLGYGAQRAGLEGRLRGEATEAGACESGLYLR